LIGESLLIGDFRLAIARALQRLRNPASRDAAELPAELLGTWISDPNDRAGIDEFGNLSLEFVSDGSLKYTIHTEATDQIMLLSCRVEDGVLVSNQASAPREERTPYSIDSAGKLTVSFQGRRAVLIRADGE